MRYKNQTGVRVDFREVRSISRPLFRAADLLRADFPAQLCLDGSPQAVGAVDVLVLGVPADAAGAARIAQRSRGTPRIANRLLRRVRDYAEVRADGRITDEVVLGKLICSKGLKRRSNQ